MGDFSWLVARRRSFGMIELQLAGQYCYFRRNMHLVYFMVWFADQSHFNMYHQDIAASPYNSSTRAYYYFCSGEKGKSYSSSTYIDYIGYVANGVVVSRLTVRIRLLGYKTQEMTYLKYIFLYKHRK